MSLLDVLFIIFASGFLINNVSCDFLSEEWNSSASNKRQLSNEDVINWIIDDFNSRNAHPWLVKLTKVHHLKKSVISCVVHQI